MSNELIKCVHCKQPLYHADDVVRVLTGQIFSFEQNNSMEAYEELWYHQRCFKFLIETSEQQRKDLKKK